MTNGISQPARSSTIVPAGQYAVLYKAADAVPYLLPAQSQCRANEKESLPADTDFPST